MNPLVNPQRLQQMQAEVVQKLITVQAWTLASDPGLFEEFHETLTEVLNVGRSQATTFLSQRRRRVATEDEVRTHGAGLSARQWTKCRCALGRKLGVWFPAYNQFQDFYGTSFQGVMRGYEAYQTPATEDEVRTHGAGLTTTQWDEKRLVLSKQFGRLFPRASAFRTVYGKTFAELMNDKPQLPMASPQLVLKHGRGLKTTEWEAARPALEAKYKKQFPGVGAFLRLYGKTYQEFMTGQRKGGELASEQEVRKHAEGLTQSEWNARCKALSKRYGKVFTYSCNFRRRYGKTFAQVLKRKA